MRSTRCVVVLAQYRGLRSVCVSALGSAGGAANRWKVRQRLQTAVAVSRWLGREGEAQAVLSTHCGQLILRKKISNFDATRCQISRLKCTEFDFRRSTDPDTLGELSALLQTP